MLVSSDERCTYYFGIARLRDWMFFVGARRPGLQGLKFADSGTLKAYSLADENFLGKGGVAAARATAVPPPAASAAPPTPNRPG